MCVAPSAFSKDEIACKYVKISSQRLRNLSGGSSNSKSYLHVFHVLLASSEDLEWQKRKEYEDWFKNQEKEALEYSAVCEYQEKAGESREITTQTTTTSTRESHLTRQQHQTQGRSPSTQSTAQNK